MMRQVSREESESCVRWLYASLVRGLIPLRGPVFGVYLLGTGFFIYTFAPRLATEIFPTVDAGQFQLRMRAPTGTRVERTEAPELKALDVSRPECGREQV